MANKTVVLKGTPDVKVIFTMRKYKTPEAEAAPSWDLVPSSPAPPPGVALFAYNFSLYMPYADYDDRTRMTADEWGYMRSYTLDVIDFRNGYYYNRETLFYIMPVGCAGNVRFELINPIPEVTTDLGVYMIESCGIAEFHINFGKFANYFKIGNHYAEEFIVNATKDGVSIGSCSIKYEFTA